MRTYPLISLLFAASACIQRPVYVVAPPPAEAPSADSAVLSGSAQSANGVEMVGTARAWFGPRYEMPGEVRLWVGSLWRNRSPQTLLVSLDYAGEVLPNATGLSGCGVRSETIRPGESAWIVCSPLIVSARSVLPNAVIMRNTSASVAALEATGVVVDSLVWRESRVDRVRSPFEIARPSVFARAVDRDVTVTPLFRLYGADSVQVGTCFSWNATLRREAALRLLATGCTPREAVRGEIKRVEVSFYQY